MLYAVEAPLNTATKKIVAQNSHLLPASNHTCNAKHSGMNSKFLIKNEKTGGNTRLPFSISNFVVKVKRWTCGSQPMDPVYFASR